MPKLRKETILITIYTSISTPENERWTLKSGFLVMGLHYPSLTSHFYNFTPLPSRLLYIHILLPYLILYKVISEVKGSIYIAIVGIQVFIFLF